MDIPCVKKSFMVAVFMLVKVVTRNTSRRPIIHSVIVPINKKIIFLLGEISFVTYAVDTLGSPQKIE